MPFLILQNGRNLGSYASPDRAIVEMLRIIGMDARVVGDTNEIDGHEGHGWERLGTVRHCVERMEEAPLKGVSIVELESGG